MFDDDYEFDSRRDEALQARAREQATSYGLHCPECLSTRLFMTTFEETLKMDCSDCGLSFLYEQSPILRALPSQPAPPYTATETMQLAYAQGYIL